MSKSRPLKIAVTMLDCFKDVIEIYENNSYGISYQDQLTNDLLHELELSDLSVARKLKLLGELRECRIKRRMHKNENEQLLQLYDIINQSEAFKNKLQKAEKKIDVIINRQRMRQYHPRVKTS